MPDLVFSTIERVDMIDKRDTGALLDRAGGGRLPVLLKVVRDGFQLAHDENTGFFR
jgi:hypothetical protein